MHVDYSQFVKQHDALLLLESTMDVFVPLVLFGHQDHESKLEFIYFINNNNNNNI